MAKIFWIKIQTDIFSNKKIKKIRRMPEGNNITLIWIYLITKAGECNKNGGLYISEMIPYDADDIANELDFKLKIVQYSIKILEKFGMIEIIDDAIYIKNWEEYQNTDSLEKIREQGRLRAARFRDKQKLLPSTTQNNVISNGEVTLRNATEEELELDKELEEEKKDPIPYGNIIKYLNNKSNKKYRHTSVKTKDCIKARFNEGFNEEDFKKVIDIKVKDWLGSEKYNKFIRPETLFGNKFESYLNQEVKSGYNGANQEDESVKGYNPDDFFREREERKARERLNQ